jgi:hypothetical protein
MKDLTVHRPATPVKLGKGQAALAAYHQLNDDVDKCLQCLAPPIYYDPDTATLTANPRNLDQLIAAAERQLRKLPALRAKWKLAGKRCGRDAIVILR